MKRIFILSVWLLIAIVAFAESCYVGYVELDRSHDVAFSLEVDVCDKDTTWTIVAWGDGLNEHTQLLFKTMDGKVLELTSYRYTTLEPTDAWVTNPITGESVRQTHYEFFMYYRITPIALDYFITHGIAKLRVGTDSLWREHVWRTDELGKELSKARAELNRRLAPDYVPPKKPSIRDGF